MENSSLGKAFDSQHCLVGWLREIFLRTYELSVIY